MKVNPTQLISMIKQGQNPQQLILSILEQNAQSNPIQANLYQLAKEGKTNEIEQIIRNIYQEKGLDFDKEFTAFKQQWRL